VSLVRGLALATLVWGAPALAQTAPPSATSYPCSPPCAPNETCFQGQCMVPAPPAGTPEPPQPVIPELPPPPEAAPPPAPPPAAETPETEEPPPPRRKRRPPPPKPLVVEEEDGTPAAWRRGVLVMPFVGFHAVEGIAADDYDAGPRVGFLLGAHAAPAVSLNVELAMDFLSPKVNMAVRGTEVSGRDFTIAFSPLFHARSGIGEFVVGPKLGFWSSGIDVRMGAQTIQNSQSGWAYGFNIGAFAGVHDSAALGALVSYQMTYLDQSCARGSGLTASTCDSAGPVPQILSFNLAAIF
jgi:hypothetical protein